MWFSSVQFNDSVVSESLWPHGLQHARLPSPSPIPKASSNSCPLSQWCPPTISSSSAPFSSCPQSFPASGSFPVSQLFPSGGQNIGTSASATILPMNIQGWFPLGLSGLIYLQSKGLSRVSPAPQFESISSSALSLLHSPNFTAVQDHWKSHNFDYMQLCQQGDVSTFSYTAYVSYNFPSKEQLSFDFMAAVTIHSNFGAQENKICHYFHTSPFCFPWSDVTWCHDLRILNIEFSLSSFTFKRLFNSVTTEYLWQPLKAWHIL